MSYAIQGSPCVSSGRKQGIFPLKKAPNKKRCDCDRLKQRSTLKHIHMHRGHRGEEREGKRWTFLKEMLCVRNQIAYDDCGSKGINDVIITRMKDQA